MSDTSISLLERLRDGPAEPDWRRLHELYEPLLQNWIARAGVPRGEGDDLVQEVMIVLVKEVAGFERRREGSFRAWLRGILANRLREFFRTHRRATGGSEFLQHLGELEDPDSALSRVWDREHDEHLARRLLRIVERDLAPDTWRAFKMQVVEGLPAKETAERTGLSLNAVLLAKSRALKRLREEMRGFVE